MDGPTYESTHQLLLGLAGHVDDDLLGWLRELVAVGEEARAVSLLTADVAAERIALPVAVRDALVGAAQAARVGIDAAALATAAEPAVDHRFAASPAGTSDLATALRSLPARQLDGTTVRLAWRLTPAGTAPGPLPHPVVLVEIDPGRHSGEMLAYLVASGLARGGVHAAVEVIAAGQAHTVYHEAALAVSTPIAVGESAEKGPRTAAVPVESTVEPKAEPAEPVAAITEPVRLVDPVDVDPVVPDGEDSDTAPDPDDDVPTDDGSEPEPEAVLDPSERHPLAGDPAEPAAPARPRPVAGSPALTALSDPLSGPLSQPLMAPLLDPTIHAHDPLGVDHLVGPSRHPFAAPEQAPEPQPEVKSAPESAQEPEPPEPDEPIEDSWAAEWESGAWAMPLDDLEGDAVPELVPEPDDTAPDEPPRRSRHGIAPQDERPPEPPRPVRAVPPPPEPPRPVRAVPSPPVPQRPVPRERRRSEEPPAVVPPPPAPRSDRAEAATRSDAARLSDADRELLARLQAELVDGRKPRAPRRPGAPTGGRPVANGRGPNHRDDPPDAS